MGPPVSVLVGHAEFLFIAALSCGAISNAALGKLVGFWWWSAAGGVGVAESAGPLVVTAG